MSDTATTALIGQVHRENYGVDGTRKVHAELHRQGWPVARGTVERLMRAAGLRGINRAEGPRTTIAGTGPGTGLDLVKRKFTARCPDQLWVAGITYCRTFAGWVYAAFVIDVFSRRVMGWQLSKNLRPDLTPDALMMGIWTRQRDGHDAAGVTHHSDKAVQYLAMRYSHRLAEASAVASVGTNGDSYETALAEAFNSLFKAELIRNKGPRTNIDDLEIAFAEYVDWFNHRRLHGEIGLIPPTEHEDHYYRHNPPRVPSERQFKASTESGARHPEPRRSRRAERGHQARADLETPNRRRPDLLRPPGTSNGPTEAINGRLEHLRGSALGFRNLTNYIARSLLESGGFRPQLHPRL